MPVLLGEDLGPPERPVPLQGHIGEVEVHEAGEFVGWRWRGRGCPFRLWERRGGNSGVEGRGEARTGWTCNTWMSMGLDGRSRGVRAERKNRMG